MHKNIVLRSNVISSTRRRMTDLGFQEYQTPILTASIFFISILFGPRILLSFIWSHTYMSAEKMASGD